MSDERHLVVGIDPGHSGAIVAGYLGVPESVTITDMGSNRVVVVHNVMSVIGKYRPCAKISVFLERSASQPGAALQAVDTYMKHYGNIEASLLAARVPECDIHEIRPQEWQRLYAGLVPATKRQGGAALERAVRRDIIKTNSRFIATKLYPKFAYLFAGSGAQYDGRSDATLIFTYGLRRLSGEISAPPPAVKVRSSGKNGKGKKKRTGGPGSRIGKPVLAPVESGSVTTICDPTTGRPIPRPSGPSCDPTLSPAGSRRKKDCS